MTLTSHITAEAVPFDATATPSPLAEAAIESATLPKTDTSKPESTAQAGMECDSQHLYRKEDERGRTSWIDVYPIDLDEAAENEITARFAILVRNKKSYDPRKKLEIDSIVIQSPLIKTVLYNALKNYPGRSTCVHS